MPGLRQFEAVDGIQRLQFAIAPALVVGEEHDALGVAGQNQIGSLVPLSFQVGEFQLDHDRAEKGTVPGAHRVRQEVARYPADHADRVETPRALGDGLAEIRAETVVVTDIAGRQVPVARRHRQSGAVEQFQGRGAGGPVDAFQLEVQALLQLVVDRPGQRRAQFGIQRQHRRQAAEALDQGLQRTGVEVQLLAHLLALGAQRLLAGLPAGPFDGQQQAAEQRQQQQEQAQRTGHGHRRIETAAASGDDSTTPGYTARRTRSPPMSLSPWSHPCSAGFTLRGWRSEPSGKPLLHFLHGNGFCGRTYEPMLRLLTEDFDLWLCDIQGHGESDHGGRFHGWNRNAEMAVEAFEAGRGRYGDVPRLACGHSFGGVLSSLVLARHPGLFTRAVLLDPVLFTPAMIGVMALSETLGLQLRGSLAKKARLRRSQWPDRAAAYAGLRGRGIFKGWTDEALWAYVEYALKESDDGVELKCRPSREAEIFSSFPGACGRRWARSPRRPGCCTATAPIPSSPGRWRAGARSTRRSAPAP